MKREVKNNEVIASVRSTMMYNVLLRRVCIAGIWVLAHLIPPHVIQFYIYKVSERRYSVIEFIAFAFVNLNCFIELKMALLDTNSIH